MWAYPGYAELCIVGATSPLGWARAIGTLAANLESWLGEEAGGSVGYLLPVPDNSGDGDPHATLKADLRAGKGRTMLVEMTSVGFGEGRMAARQEDWKPRRFGASPPDVHLTLRTDVVMACCLPVAFP